MPPSTPATPAILVYPCNGNPETWNLTGEQLTEWTGLYPGLDVVGECRRAMAWVKARGKKTARGMPRYLVSWLNRSNDRRGSQQSPPATVPESFAARDEREAAEKRARNKARADRAAATLAADIAARAKPDPNAATPAERAQAIAKMRGEVGPPPHAGTTPGPAHATAVQGPLTGSATISSNSP